MNAAARRFELQQEYDGSCAEVMEILDDLGAVPALRAATPPQRQFLVDRLETNLRLLDRIDGDLSECEFSEDELTDMDGDEEDDDEKESQ